MAEEIASNPTSEKTEVVPAAPAEKKKRAPRQKKAAANSAVAVSAAAESKLGRGRKGVAPAEVPQTEAKKRGGRVQKTETNKVEAPVKVLSPPVSSGYEISDLLELETENQRLRKALAEKLRQENDDLRKRLGTK